MLVKFGFSEMASGQQRGAGETSFDSATITEWHISVGDNVSEGQSLASVQLDKGEGELESPVAGVIIEIREKYLQPGSAWQIGLDTEILPNKAILFLPHLGIIETEDIGKGSVQTSSQDEGTAQGAGSQEPVDEGGIDDDCRIEYPEDEGDDSQLRKKFTPVSWRLLHAKGLNPADVAVAFPDEPRGKIGKERILEFKAELDRAQEGGPIAVQDARRLARENGLDLSGIAGSGLDGLILTYDVEEYIGKITPEVIPDDPTEESDRVTLNASLLRKATAEFLRLSHDEIVKAGDAVEVRVSRLWDFRERYKQIWKYTTGTTLRFDYIFSYIAIRFLMKDEFRIINAFWDKEREEGYIFKNVNLGIAVNKRPTKQDPYGALMVPVIHNADTLSFLELAKSAEDKIKRVHSGKITLPELQDLTFTVNNVGGMGGIDPDSLVPYTRESNGRKRPTGMILVLTAMKSHEGNRYMKLAFSFDHRLFDGAPAINFVGAIKRYVEGIKDPDGFIEELLGSDSSLIK